MAKTNRPSGANSLLAQVPKRGQAAIARIMEERGGTLTLPEFLAQRWNIEKYFCAEGMSKKEIAQRIAEDESEMASQQPAWSKEKIRAVLSLSYSTMDLKEATIARRFTLDDPAELGRGLSVLSRLRWLDLLINHHSFVDFDFVVEAFAAHDLKVGPLLAKGEPAVSDGKPEFLDLCSIAVEAIGRKDMNKLRATARRMAKEKLRPWQRGICLCLTGIADGEAGTIAEGLTELLDGLHKMRQKDELEEAINLPAHGLYRLAEWVSPDLVATFDVSQAFPWDAGFHAWCQSHPDPLESVDLSSISPDLHAAVVLLQPPREWTSR